MVVGEGRRRSVIILENKCQVRGQIYSHHPTTTEELCSMLLTGKGSVITIITKLGYVKAFTPCVSLILTQAHKKAMKTIPIGPLWRYSVTWGLLITIGDETWIHKFETGPTRHHIMSPGTNQFNVISSKKSRPIFCDMEAWLYIYFSHSGTTVNSNATIWTQ